MSSLIWVHSVCYRDVLKRTNRRHTADAIYRDSYQVIVDIHLREAFAQPRVASCKCMNIQNILDTVIFYTFVRINKLCFTCELIDHPLIYYLNTLNFQQKIITLHETNFKSLTRSNTVCNTSFLLPEHKKIKMKSHWRQRPQIRHHCAIFLIFALYTHIFILFYFL